MARDLYVVVHPEATHHTEGLVGGWYDSALTATGERQARLIADRFGHRMPPETRIFSSDLRRAEDTARRLGRTLGIEVETDPDLREQSYGMAGGTPVGTMSAVPPPAEGDRLNHCDGVPGSESRGEFAGRVYRAMNRICARPWDHAIIVAHGGTLTYCVAAWIAIPLAAVGYMKLTASAGGITHLREDPVTFDRRIVSLDDVAHLD